MKQFDNITRGYEDRRLYVGHLSSWTRCCDLNHIFRRYGRVRDVNMKRNYAFVEFCHPGDADNARHYLDGSHVDGHRITVEFSRRRDYTRRCFNCGIDGHWKRDCKAVTLRGVSHSPVRSFQHNLSSKIQYENIETQIDFFQLLDEYVCAHIMSFLDDPVDIVCASAVSRSWHHLVIANEFAKRACLKRIHGITNIVGTCIMRGNQRKIVSDMDNERKVLRRNHNVYAPLFRAINTAKVKDTDLVRMHNEVCASSTNKYPNECILNTMYIGDKFSSGKPSYWSSKGHENPDVPDTLIYKLSNGWALSKIYIKPFKAFFQPGEPIYSAKYVQFRVGHPKSWSEFKREYTNYGYNWPSEEPVNDKFVWSYVSPAFPMAQKDISQQFKLPEPVLCIDAYLQIELLGRVQRNEKDGLFYNCVSFVHVLGRPLAPAFDIERTRPDKQLILKFYPEDLKSVFKTYNPTYSNMLYDMFHESQRVLEEILGEGEEEMLEYILGEEEGEEDLIQDYLIQIQQKVPKYNGFVMERDCQMDRGFDY